MAATSGPDPPVPVPPVPSPIDRAVLEWISDPDSHSEVMPLPAGRAVHPARPPSVLLSVGPLLQREVELDTLLAAMVDTIARQVGADRGTVYLLDPEAGELFSKAAHLPELKQIRLKVGQGIAGTVAETGATVNLTRADADRRFFQEIDRLTGYRTRSMLATPVRDGDGHVMGVLQVLNAAGGAFTADDEEMLKRLAAEAALAIESTSLYPEVRPHGKAGHKARHPGAGPPLPVRYRYNRVIGESPAMQAVYTLLRKAAATSATVLLRGESGTGKELIARAIHYNGPRREQPFVKLDCTTIPTTLMENELFGHEKGAYTGAGSRAAGKCEQAQGGTLFIDEIGELPLTLQAKLLRFIQDREFERVGGTRTLTADVRVVAATHRDLEAMVGRGGFREDLYYRVKVVQMVLPPLRERGAEDLFRLARHFLETYARKHGKPELTLSREALDRLTQHRWPGNIRELENCVESAVVLCERPEIRAEHLALPQLSAEPVGPVAPAAAAAAGAYQPRSLEQVEREHIARTLAHVEGNRTRAAEILGIGRNTLVRKLRGYRL
jgi:Nif-specific regulatory protein